MDIDGDGKPELVKSEQLLVQVYSITGSDGLAGAPSAGRLIGIDNEFGAKTNIHYRSIKGDTSVTKATHQVPFAEIVVDSVDTSNSNGSRLGATFHAYGGAELLFDPAHDRFTFPGYRRTITLQAPQGQLAGVGAFIVSDSYAPVSAADPYGIRAGATPNLDQRYAQFRRFGRVRDVTVLSGNFGAAALADPRQLLDIDVTSDSHRIAGAHYEWDARRLTSSSDGTGPEVCTEAIYPYDYQASKDYVDPNAVPKHPGYDPCIAHGFAFSSSVQSWRGDPSTSTIETRSEVLSIDDLGRVTSVKPSNDIHRTDDDLCVVTEFAQPPQDSYPRVLTAVASRTVSDCNTNVVLAKDTFGYDGSAAGSVVPGSVSLGHVTSHDVERRDDTGTPKSTIHQFDTTWSASGNPHTITTTRGDGDGASRTVTVDYDPFDLAIIHLKLEATGLQTTEIFSDRDALTLAALSTTDPNGTKRGARFDGFDRQTMSTITPPGGTEGALWFNRYNLSSGTRNIRHTIFQTAVAPGNAASAAGRTTITYLDGLGRASSTLFGLGADFPSQAIAISRVFDTLGRVAFEADPYPSSQSSATAYGTTYFFNPDGTLLCSVRGNGPQTKIPGTVDANQVVHPSTDESKELYPTCVQRTFQSNTELVTLRDSSSYLTGSPQEGVAKKSYVTATGRVMKRSTLGKDGTQLEYATLDYDRLGHLTSMTRYQDANGGANPVTSSWHYDSLGQLLSLQEPDSALQTNTYSNWGELLDSGRGSLHSVATYDALGRVVHREDQRDGVTDAATVNDYHYDSGVNVTTLVTPTYTLGRLAQASWPTGSVSLSYDAAGDVNARVFLAGGLTYVEKGTFNDDGSLRLLDLFAPDTGLAKEEAAYDYDTAGPGKSVVYKTGDNLQNSQTLLSSPTFDGLSRVRSATVGGLTNYAAVYTDAGRNLIQQVTISSMVGSRQISFAAGAFDPMGRERLRTETKTDGGTTTTSTTSNVYDALGRLSSSVKTAGGTTVFNQQFAYDPLGNLLSQTDTASGAINTTLTYYGASHDRDRICHIAYGTDSNTACNVTYDDAGAITSMPTPSGVQTFDYLVNGSVKTIEDDRLKADLRYDAFGEVQELDLDVKTGTAPVGTDTRHDRHYGTFTRHDETTGPVVLRKISGPNGLLATRHGPGGKWVFTFGEQRGTRFQTDEGGNFVQDVNYQPFGKPASTGAAFQPGNSLYSNEQWNGGDYLAAFGISQLGARLYNSAIGRFLSRDPLLSPRTAATTNPYAFAANDPVNRSDPTGLLYTGDDEAGEEGGTSGVGGSAADGDGSPIAVNGETIVVDGGAWVGDNGINLALFGFPLDLHMAAIEAAGVIAQPSVVETVSPAMFNTSTSYVKNAGSGDSKSRILLDLDWGDLPPLSSTYPPADTGSDPYDAEYHEALNWGPLGILKMLYSDNAPMSIKVLRWGIDVASVGTGAVSLVRGGIGLLRGGIAAAEVAEGAGSGGAELIDPLAVRFTQSSIKQTLRTGENINDVIAALRGPGGDSIAAGFAPIRIFENEGLFFSLDNRRLAIFSAAGREIPFVWATPEEVAAEAWKFTATVEQQNGWFIRVK